MTFFWAVLAGAMAVSMEALFRHGLVWHEKLWLVLPLSVGINYSIYRTVIGAPTLLLAIAVFGAATATLRMGVSQFWLGEPVSKGNLVAGLALVVGTLAGYMWR